MQVTKELNDYPEKNLRRKKWMQLIEVIELSDSREIKQLVKKLAEQILRSR